MKKGGEGSLLWSQIQSRSCSNHGRRELSLIVISVNREVFHLWACLDFNIPVTRCRLHSELWYNADVTNIQEQFRNSIKTLSLSFSPHRLMDHKCCLHKHVISLMEPIVFKSKDLADPHFQTRFTDCSLLWSENWPVPLRASIMPAAQIHFGRLDVNLSTVLRWSVANVGLQDGLARSQSAAMVTDCHLASSGTPTLAEAAAVSRQGVRVAPDFQQLPMFLPLFNPFWHQCAFFLFCICPQTSFKCWNCVYFCSQRKTVWPAELQTSRKVGNQTTDWPSLISKLASNKSVNPDRNDIIK